jgi:hypothetical protein
MYFYWYESTAIVEFFKLRRKLIMVNYRDALKRVNDILLDLCLNLTRNLLIRFKYFLYSPGKISDLTSLDLENSIIPSPMIDIIHHIMIKALNFFSF